MNTTISADLDVITTIIEEHQGMAGPTLPILHAIQDAFGYVPAAAVPRIAKALNLSRAEVHGVLSFYHDFRQEPGGRHTLRICRAEACQSRGAEALAEYAKAALDCDFHETTADGAVNLEPVYCLGQCACGPAMMMDEEVHARVTPAKFDALIDAVRGDK